MSMSVCVYVCVFTMLCACPCMFACLCDFFICTLLFVMMKLFCQSENGSHVVSSHICSHMAGK